MQPLLLLLVFLLAPKAQAVKIIGGHEVKPHSRPYMAFLRIRISDRKRCGGFLVREDFVLTAAHCWGRSITVILGAHNIRKRERTQQVIPVKTAIRHPNYHPKVNDIMLLQGYDCARVPGHLLNENSCPLPSAAEEGYSDCCREPPQATQEGRAGEARDGVQSGRLGATQPEHQHSHTA
ncbi:Granzyme B [Myotis davidii]|uniref:Granzyme B n=1 Tax=Myotis davidii TaxID=225400 RepID=L5M183_MYODS|nr:Granzyme B [Myotis davidii]